MLFFDSSEHAFVPPAAPSTFLEQANDEAGSAEVRRRLQ
jgi:hypothetical protein